MTSSLAEEEPQDGSPLTSELCLLFVDDEEKSRKYFPRLFRDLGKIMVAEDGCEGLEVLMSEQGGSVAVVITDQIMPRMTGLDLLKRVSDHNPNIVRVLSTAYTESSLVEEAVESGLIEYFVSKPWDIPKLKKVLEQSIEHFHYNLTKTPLSE